MSAFHVRRSFTFVHALALLAGVGVVLLARLAHAQTSAPGAGPSVLQALLVQDVLPLAASLALTLVTALIGLGLRYAQKRWRLTLTQQQVAHLDELAGKAIAYAEEKAAASVKAGDPKLSGNYKLDMAIGFLRQEAEQAGIPAQIESRWADLIHSKLGATPGVGASVTPDASGRLIASR